MTSPPLLRHALALACAAVVTVAAPARAEVFDLGTITATSDFLFADILRSDPFEDIFTFRIAAGMDGFEFHGTAYTNFSNRFWIPDLDGRLDRGATLVREADQRTVWSPEFPRHEADFASTLLTAGTYSLHVSGTPTSAFPGPSSYYSLGMVFNVAPAVPEPGAMALMGLGLAGVAWVARRRRR